MGRPMHRRPMHLTDQRTLHATMTILHHHIPRTADGYRCQTPDLWRIVLGAARQRSIEAVCADLLDVPHANTVRSYLTTQLLPQPIPDLEHRWNDALTALLPDWLYVRPQSGSTSITSPTIAARMPPIRTTGSAGAKRRRAPPISIAVPPPTSSSATCASLWRWSLSSRVTTRSRCWSACSRRYVRWASASGACTPTKPSVRSPCCAGCKHSG